MNFALPTGATSGMVSHGQSPLPRIRLHSGRVIHIEVTDRIETAEPAWRRLFGPDNFATAYQNYDFCALWLRHVGAGLRPFIVIGREDNGAPLFLWPLVRNRMGPCTIASYFCGSHANFRTTLWRSDFAEKITAQDLRAIVAELSGHGIDAIVLQNQSRSWNGAANPLLHLPHQSSPNETYGITLFGKGDEVIARHLNAETRRKLRRKERKLAELPGYRYARPSTAADVDRYLTEFMKQKAARLSSRGIQNAFSEPGVEEFLRAACLHGLASGQPLIEIHVLDSDGDMPALFSGIQDTHCFSTMFNSYTMSEQSRWSPGFNLLLKLVDECAKRGFATLDLGVGAAEYKSSLCDIENRLFDSFIGLSMRGRVLTLLLRAAYGLKGAIKRNPALLNVVHSLRTKLFARSAAQ